MFVKSLQKKLNCKFAAASNRPRASRAETETEVGVKKLAKISLAEIYWF